MHCHFSQISRQRHHLQPAESLTVSLCFDRTCSIILSSTFPQNRLKISTLKILSELPANTELGVNSINDFFRNKTPQSSLYLMFFSAGVLKYSNVL